MTTCNGGRLQMFPCQLSQPIANLYEWNFESQQRNPSTAFQFGFHLLYYGIRAVYSISISYFVARMSLIMFLL